MRVLVASENRLLREALARRLGSGGGIDVLGRECEVPWEARAAVEMKPDVLVLTSSGSAAEDAGLIRQMRASVPGMRILLIGMVKDAGEFLLCVRAGISGYLPADSCAAEVLKAVEAVQAGEAVCPGELCTSLFRYFEYETAGLPCASSRQRLGLTRREQQLIPLIAQGLTNKEIANHFCLSEQTVKNHLYRMKHKVGAEDRLDIVQLYRTQGFLV